MQKNKQPAAKKSKAANGGKGRVVPTQAIAIQTLPSEKLAKFLADPTKAEAMHLPDDDAQHSAIVRQTRKLTRSGVLRGANYQSLAVLCNDPEYPLLSSFDDGESINPHTLFTLATFDRVQGEFLYNIDNPVDSPVNSVSRIYRNMLSPSVPIPLYGARAGSVALIPDFSGSKLAIPVQPDASADGKITISGMFTRLTGAGTTGDAMLAVSCIFVDAAGTDTTVSASITNPGTGLTEIPFAASITVPATATGVRDVRIGPNIGVTGVLEKVNVSYRTNSVAWFPAANAQLGVLRGYALPSVDTLVTAEASARLTANTALFSNVTSVLDAAGTITAAGFPATVPWVQRATASISSLGAKIVSRQFKAVDGMYAAMCPDSSNDFRAIAGMVKDNTNAVVAFFSSPTNDNSFQIIWNSAIEVVTNDQAFLMTHSTPDEDIMRPIEASCEQAPLLVWSENPGHTSAISKFLGRVSRKVAPYWKAARQAIGLASTSGIGGPVLRGVDQALGVADAIAAAMDVV